MWSYDLEIKHWPLLPMIILLPFISSLVLMVLPLKVYQFKKLALSLSLIPFWLFVIVWVLYDTSSFNFQFVFTVPWFYPVRFGIDGVSLSLIGLSTYLFPFCLLIGWNSINKMVSSYVHLLFLLEGILMLTFTSLDFFFFYLFFESTLIPVFLIIGIWGSRDRKVLASYKFFLYTLAGSFFMFGVILYFLVGEFGMTDIEYLCYSSLRLDSQLQKILWVLVFFTIAVKVPLFPLHLWLPEAHVEAPTAGSVLLAGILLKLGIYGFLRVAMPMLAIGSRYYTPIVLVLSLLGILYGSLACLRQSDMKRLIAYASVSHMGYVVLGLFSWEYEGLLGGVVTMISHGVVSSAWFIIIGVLYDRYKTRAINYYRGLAVVMPLLALVKTLIVLANISLPGTSSFVGEFLILLGVFMNNRVLAILAALGMITGVGYSIWFLNRLLFGQLSPTLFPFNDISKRELAILLPLILVILILGIFPDVLIETVEVSVLKLDFFGKC